MPMTLGSVKAVLLSWVTFLGSVLIGIVLGLLWLRFLRHVLPDVIVNWGGPVVAFGSYSVARRVLSRLTGAGSAEPLSDLWFQIRGRVAKLVGKADGASPVRDVREFKTRVQDFAHQVGYGTCPSHRRDVG